MSLRSREDRYIRGIVIRCVCVCVCVCRSVADNLKAGALLKPELFLDASVYFSDIDDFTSFVSELSPLLGDCSVSVCRAFGRLHETDVSTSWVHCRSSTYSAGCGSCSMTSSPNTTSTKSVVCRCYASTPLIRFAVDLLCTTCCIGLLQINGKSKVVEFEH